jgi:hypothetical protein
MSLVTGCQFPNPFGAAQPAVPVAAAAPNLAPAQGDHVFGDVIGAINTAFTSIFGGGAVAPARMQNYHSMLATLWQGMMGANYGHGAAAPVVTRNGAPEPDQHSHVFGGYAARLQWQLAEIACAGFHPPPLAAESRRIAAPTSRWKRATLAALDDLLNVLVDSTALQFYMATPAQMRQANPAAVNHTR